MTTNDDEPLGKRPGKVKRQSDYEVGFEKPPKQHQFKPGNNANPKGRPKGARNRKLIVRDIAFEPVEIKIGGEIRKLPRIALVFVQVMNRAIKGDSKAADVALRLCERFGLLAADEEQDAAKGLPKSDADILDAFVKRLGRKQSDDDGKEK